MVGKVVIGVAALVIGYGVSRIFFQKAQPSALSQSSIASQAVANCADTRDIQSLMGKVEKATDLRSPYSVSIPLLGAAYSNHKVEYGKWKEAIFQAFGIKNDEPVDSIVEKLQDKASENAWILGRLLVANLRMGDSSAKKTASIIQQLLQKAPVDPFSAWAWGYLAIFYAQTQPDEYPSVKEQMMQCSDTLMKQPEEKGKDNVLWAIVMELQSLSEVGDVASYNDCLQKFQDFSGTSSVIETLESIPPGDFRAWATSLILHAAKKMNDRMLVLELMEYLPKTIATSPSDGDKLLALLVKCSS